LPYDIRELDDRDVLAAGDVALEAVIVPGGLALLSSEGFAAVGDLAGDPPARTIRPAIGSRERDAALGRLSSAGVRRFLPGHGPVIEATQPPGSGRS
jgi:glyoxylase-like metal-dependent hydrolase (beta-lactamase superfamily II)